MRKYYLAKKGTPCEQFNNAITSNFVNGAMYAYIRKDYREDNREPITWLNCDIRYAIWNDNKMEQCDTLGRLHKDAVSCHHYPDSLIDV